MKKLLILVMLVSMGLAGVVSAERGKMIYHRWDDGNGTTTVRAYTRNFTTPPTSTNYAYAGSGSPAGLTTPSWENGGNYAARFEGWMIPPIDGNYKFWIAADDYAELWLSTSENPAGAVKIATENGWTGQNDFGDADIVPSGWLPLKANQPYYFWAAWSEGGGGDGCGVGFQCAEAGVTTTTLVPMAYVSNTCPVDLVHPYTNVGAVEYQYWKAATDVSELGIINGIMPDFSTITTPPTSTGTMAKFWVNMPAQTDDYVYRQYGIIKVDVADLYTFGTTSDDGSKLYIGNWWESGPLTLVVNNDGWHGGQWRYGSIELPAGYAGIVVEMFEDGGGDILQVNYRTSTIPWKEIPMEAIYSAKTACAPYPHNKMYVPVDAVLTWSNPVGKTNFTNVVYFAEAGKTLVKVAEGTQTSYDPELVVDKAYQWRVDVSEPNETPGGQPTITTGPTWGFFTKVEPAKKLVAYWPLDEDLADDTGNLLPGTYYSTDASAPVFEPGMKGNALAVNIAGTTNSQYARLAAPFMTGFSPTGVGNNSPRTIACWAKNAVPAAEVGNWCNVFGFTSTTSANEYVFDFNKYGGNAQYCITRYGGDWGFAPMDGTWHFLVASYDPATRIVKWYLDGVYTGQATGQQLQTQDIVHIGKRAPSNQTALFRGWVDEARIYNYALSDQEIAALYLDANPTGCVKGTGPAYDFNGNCVVDVPDLLIFAADWLKDNMVE
ncbi:MAG: hypothetical protein GX455_06480 [Phycisphaerae bacterium]|nr:hypothetical protein [Phycisphaerae bacterium]